MRESDRDSGDPSRDARYWAWLVETADAEPLGIAVWDRVTDTVVATRDVDEFGGRDIDWVSMAPSGDWVVLGAVEHADIAVGANGGDVYVSVDFAAREGWLFMVDIATLERTNLISTYTLRPEPVAYTSLHVSGKAFERPGWVVVSTFRARSVRTEWFQDKVMLIELASSPSVRRLADHHSRFAGYWTEPHATPDRSLTRVLFNSNWYSGDAEDVDAWILDVPSGGS